MAKSKTKPTGRPSALTEEVEGQILAALRTGIPLVVAAEASGIHRSTVQGWVERGKDPDSPNRDFYAPFSIAYMRAKAQGAMFLHSLVFEAARGTRNAKKLKTADGKAKQIQSRMSPMRLSAAQWLLARRFSDHYGSVLETVLAPTEDGEDGVVRRPIIAITLANVEPKAPPVAPAKVDPPT